MKELFHISKFLNEELKPFPICLELIISILLMIGIRQMYYGIEIKHPVCRFCAIFISSIQNGFMKNSLTQRDY